jgi:cytochrome c-type biogenesis protein CcsB
MPKKKATRSRRKPAVSFIHRAVQAVFLSIPASLVMGVILAAAVAAATFIEAKYGTEAARLFVYNARWFEILLALIGVNLAVNLFRTRMGCKGKETVFLFHLAFLLILAGAGVTRHFGRSGTMHIREEGRSDTVLSEANFISVSLRSDGRTVLAEKPLMLSSASRNRFAGRWKIGGRSVRLRLLDFIPGAEKRLVPADRGVPGISLMVLNGETSARLVLLGNESAEWGGMRFVWGDDSADSAAGTIIHVRPGPGGPVFSSGLDVESVNMGTRNHVSFPAGRTVGLVPHAVYTAGPVRFVMEEYIPSAGIEAVREPDPEKRKAAEPGTPAALVFEASSDGVRKTASVFWTSGETGREAAVNLDGLEIGLSYGPKALHLPFSLELADFRIDRYPGSMKPSGYVSDVTVLDPERSARIPASIYMNHILRYRGYRFYQSSYDDDEKGTFLTVSKDPGIFPTYAGYLLLVLGLVLNLFRPNGRFRMLGAIVRKPRKSAGLAAVCLFLLSGSSAVSATGGTRTSGDLDSGHGRRFGLVAVQDNQGRIKPIHSLAVELMRKEKGLKTFYGKDAGRLALGLFVYPDDAKAGGLPPELQPRTLFRLFPLKDDPSGRWVTAEEAGRRPGGEDAAFILQWSQSYRDAVRSGDWTRADSMLVRLEAYQSSIGRSLHPGPIRLKAEVFYNRFDAFRRFAQLFFWGGLALWVFVFFRTKEPKRRWTAVVGILTGLILLGFLIQTGTMGLRWYISGHAPWTNKYESMIFIAWATLLAGVAFGFRNRLAAAVAAVLSGAILYAAGLEWMDPKITTLPPVLKSIWLVIHVSVITSSYGFFGLAAVLALFNLCLLSGVTKKTARTFHPLILVQTAEIERILLVGLTLLTIGNFLGAVWANESWGRYWGWDPKETWTLITILLYAAVLHLRLVPKFGGTALFNVGSLWAFGSVLMTYFGVNLYLAGMHSYASGERPGVPAGVFAAAGLAAAVSAVALIRGRRLRS